MQELKRNTRENAVEVTSNEAVGKLLNGGVEKDAVNEDTGVRIHFMSLTPDE